MGETIMAGLTEEGKKVYDVLIEAEKNGKLTDSGKQQLKVLRKNVPQTKVDETKKSILKKKIAFGMTPGELVETPIRGFEGLGVGAQVLIEGEDTPVGRRHNFGKALERASEATKPGYVPQKGEKIGSFAGRMAATAGLTAPLIPAVGEPILISMAKGGLAASTITSIEQASRHGIVNINDIMTMGALGAALPVLKPTAELVSRLIKGAPRVAASSGTTIPREAADVVAEMPMKEFHPSIEFVQNKIVDLQKSLVNTLNDVGTELNKQRSKFGIGRTFENDLEQAIEEGRVGPPDLNFKEIANRFKFLKNAVEKTTSYGKKAIIAELDELKQSANQLISWGKTAAQDVKPVSNIEEGFLKTIIKEINGIPEKGKKGMGLLQKAGGENLLLAERAFHETRELYDILQKALSTPETAEKTILQILRGGEAVVGKQAQVLNLIKELEKKTGTKFINPILKGIASKAVKNVKSTSIFNPSEALGPDIIEKVLRGTEIAGNIVKSVGKKLSRIPAGTTSTAFPIMPRKQKEK